MLEFQIGVFRVSESFLARFEDENDFEGWSLLGKCRLDLHADIAVDPPLPPKLLNYGIAWREMAPKSFLSA